MRKAAREVSTDVDSFARRKQKLLERKRKKEAKGKKVVVFEESHEESPEVPAESDGSERKRLRLDVEVEPVREMFAEERVHISFPVEGSFFSEAKELLPEARKCLLPEDEKRYLSLGYRKVTERHLVQTFQELQGAIFLENELSTLSKKAKEATTSSLAYKADLDACKADVTNLTNENVELTVEIKRLREEKAAEEKQHKAEVARLKKSLAKLADEKENCELSASTAMSYKLMKQFLDHKGEKWDPEKTIREYEEMQELEQGLSGDEDEEDEEEDDEEKEVGEEKTEEKAADDEKVEEKLEERVEEKVDGDTGDEEMVDLS